jgi:TRAP-type C4-dicarboxylate transport system permease small subunit
MFSTLTNGIRRFIALLSRALQVIVAIGVAVIMFAIIFHITGRYFFGVTHMGTMELVRYTMIWVSLLGAALAFQAYEHVTVNLFERWLSKRLRYKLNIAADALLCTFLAAMIVGGIKISLRNMSQISLGMQIPMGYPYFAIPVGGVSMLLYVLLDMMEKITEIAAPR